MSKVYLVSCVSKKRSKPAPARDLYTSAWFVKAKNYVEVLGANWYILSAEYGLVHPDEEIKPYERTLLIMRREVRMEWAIDVLERLNIREPDLSEAVFLAGERYRENLEPMLCPQGIEVSVPMRGLTIGRQLAFLDGEVRRLRRGLGK